MNWGSMELLSERRASRVLASEESASELATSGRDPILRKACELLSDLGDDLMLLILLEQLWSWQQRQVKVYTFCW